MHSDVTDAGKSRLEAAAAGQSATEMSPRLVKLAVFPKWSRTMHKNRRWISRAACIAASLILVACSGLRTTYLEDGSRGYLVSCKGYLNSWESCLIKAGKICGTRGYNPIRSEPYDRTILFSCKDAVAANARR